MKSTIIQELARAGKDCAQAILVPVGNEEYGLIVGMTKLETMAMNLAVGLASQTPHEFVDVALYDVMLVERAVTMASAILGKCRKVSEVETKLGKS